MTKLPDHMPDDLLPDPDESRGATTAEELANEVIGHLLRHPDPAQRYAAVNLVAEQATRVRAVTIHQVIAEVGGVDDAAAKLGITRQALGEVLRRAEAPNPRGRRTGGPPENQPPAYLYGQWLGHVQRLADAAGTRDHYDKLLDNAARATTYYPAIRRYAEQWLAQVARRRRAAADQHRATLADADPADAVAVLGVRHLSTAEQSQLWIGFHHVGTQSSSSNTHGKS